MCLLVSFAIKIPSKIMHAHLHIHNVPKRFSIFFEKLINHVTIHIKHLNIFPLKKTKRKINKLNSNLLLLQKNADTKKTTRIKTKQICSIYENKKQMTKSHRTINKTDTTLEQKKIEHTGNFPQYLYYIIYTTFSRRRNLAFLVARSSFF